MSQTELDFPESIVDKRNEAPVKLMLSMTEHNSNTIDQSNDRMRLMDMAFPPYINKKGLSSIDPLGLKLYRDNGNEIHIPLELIMKDNDTPAPELNLKISSPKSAQEGKQLALPKNVALSDQEFDNPYRRVGCTYYKTLYKKDRYGILRKEYKLWKKGEITQDHGKEFVKSIPQYDEFTIIPNNIDYQSVIGNYINLYSEFTHKPNAGEWVWTERLMKQVFGDQYELGLRYMQILYLHPNRSTVILVLVSKERGTGKTTFINWLNMIFGANMVVLSNTDFSGSFNSYGTKNIIAVEETFLEKKGAVEKLKAIATAKQILINEKFVSPYMLPFYGKVILTSNNEDKFVQVDEEEIRYFVRKLRKPEFKNHNIEADLLKEIPAFLKHLQSLPPVDWSVSRSGFTPEELHNNYLQAVKDESRSGLAKDLEIHLTEYFDNNEQDTCHATAKDIKERFFSSKSSYDINYIRTVLKNELDMTPDNNPIRYHVFDAFPNSRTGRPYEFKREDYVTTDKCDKE